MVKKDLLTQHLGIPAFNFTLLSLLFLFFTSSISSVQAQSLACNDRVNISVSENCTLPLEIDKFQEGTLPILNKVIRIKPNNGSMYLQQLTLGTNNQLVLGPNPVDFSNLAVLTRGVAKLMLGKVHTYEIYHTDSRNKCWGTFLLEDKLAPTVICSPNTTVACADARVYLNSDIRSTSIIGRPSTVTDNCGFTDSTLVVQDKRTNCGGYIARHWSYTDCGGMKGVCADTIFLSPLPDTRIMCPDAYVQIKCTTGTSPDQIYDEVFARTSGDNKTKDTTALKAAYPFFKDILGRAAFDVNVTATANKKFGKIEGVCGFLTTFSDQLIYPCGPTCSAKTKTIRKWLVIDWCTGSTKDCTQIIERSNPDGPTIKANDIISSVDPWACASNFTFPDPTILHDACDPNPTYEVRGPAGVNIIKDPVSKKWIAVGAPKGIHEFYYVGKDCCGHEGLDTIKVTIVDQTPPVAVAKQNIVISLTTGGENDGIAKLFSNSVDNGSYDSCTPVHLELRREEDDTRDNDGCGVKGNKTYNDDGHPQDGSRNPSSPDYDPDGGLFVKFCCDDITNREGAVPFGIVKVWMRVWDDGNMSGVYGDTINGLTDNYNETWANVRVEDKLTPKIVCPADVTINCDDDASNLALVGKARAYSNCLDLDVDYRDNNGANSCGKGTVTRTWFIKSRPNITCTQKIYKQERGEEINIDRITWPDSLITTNCATDVALIKPTWRSGACDQVGLSLKSDTFYFEGNACMKIINRWTIINWCTYNPNWTGTGTQPGIWQRSTVVKVVDNVKPTLGSCAPQMYEVSGNTCTVRDLVITQTADDQGQCASDWLKWIVFVDLWGDGTNDLEYSSFLPVTDGNITNDSNGNGINDRYVAPTGRGGQVSITIPEISGSMSNHKITWRVTDGCGNVTSCFQDFMVVDKKKPTPYCLNLSSALMKNGEVELWAVDFNVASFDNCSAASNLLYTFNEAHPVLTKITQTHYFKGKGLDATLAEYNAGNAQKWIPASKSSGMIFGCRNLPAVDVKMTVWDEKLNFDYCLVKLSLLDNQGACGGNVTTGNIAGKMVSQIGQGVVNADVVLENGIAEMLKMTTTNSSGEYNFSTLMNYSYTIEGRKTDDYLNGVSTLDLVIIQKHLLGLDELSNPYYIVAADANGDQKVTASDLTELRKLILGIYSKLPKSNSWKFINSNQTFENAKQPWPLNEKIAISEMNKSMTNQNFVAVKIGDVNGSASGNVANSSTEVRSTVELTTEDKTVKAGEAHNIVLNSNITNVFGMQFTLTVNNAELKDVFVGDQKLGQGNIARISDNKYTISWNDVSSKDGNEILTLQLISKADAQISDLISINSSVTSSEIYSGNDLQTNKLSLRFGGAGSSEFTLYQNEPNPFNDKTVISFNLPEAGEATLKVFDVTGQVVYKNIGSFGKGINSFTITRNDLPSKGVMIYQVESGVNAATKKMIGLE